MAGRMKGSASDARFGEGIVKKIAYLRPFACRLCRNADYAEDLVQDTLLSAWQARSSFREGTNLEAWLTTILRNKFYSNHRKSNRTVPWEDHLADLLRPQPEEGFFSTALAQTMAAIVALPTEQKDALVAVGINGESYAEAAERCGCPVGTLKSRVSRTRAHLAQMLEEIPAGPHSARMIPH